MTNLALSIALQASLLTAGGHNYDQAYQKMRVTGRPLLVLVGADWCPGCRKMKNSILPEVRRKGRLQKVEYVVVNTDEERDLAGKLMHGNSIPQLILFEKVGSKWTRKQLTGAQSVDQTASFVTRPEQAAQSDAQPTRRQ